MSYFNFAVFFLFSFVTLAIASDVQPDKQDNPVLELAQDEEKIFELSFSDNIQDVKTKLKNNNIHYEHIKNPREYNLNRLEQERDYIGEENYNTMKSDLLEQSNNPYIEFKGAINSNPLVDETRIYFGPKSISEISIESKGQKKRIMRILEALILKYGKYSKHKKPDPLFESFYWKVPQTNDETALKIQLQLGHMYLYREVLKRGKKKFKTNEYDAQINEYEENPFKASVTYELIDKIASDDEGF